MLLDQYGRPLPYVPAGRHLLNATQQGPNVPALPTIFEDIQKSVPVYDWRFLCSASRRLYLNLGTVREGIEGKSLAAVGNAWEPHYLGRNKSWGRRVKKMLIEEYHPRLDLRGWDFLTVLFLASVSMDRDCDVGVLMVTRADGSPAVQMMPAHRIGNRGMGKLTVETGPFAGMDCLNGIVVDEHGAACGAHLLADRVEGDEYVDWGRFHFLLDPLFAEQHRGFPAILHAIREMRTSMKASELEEFACLIASSIGLIEENETGSAEEKDELREPGSPCSGDSDESSDCTPRPPLAIEEFWGGLIKYFRSGTGGKLTSFMSNRPGPNWESFQDRLHTTALAPVWPVELVYGSGLKGPEVRMVQGKARRLVADRQSILRPLARRVDLHAISTWIENEIIPPDPDWMLWKHNMPALLSIDDGRDLAQQREDYKLMIINMQEILTAKGKGDYEDHVRERCHEVITKYRVKAEVEAEFGNEFQIPDHELQMYSPNEVASVNPQGGDDENDEENSTQDKDDKGERDDKNDEP